MILFLWISKKKRLIEFNLVDSILFLSFFFLFYSMLCVHRDINIDFSLFPPFLKKTKKKKKEKKSTEGIEKLMTLKSSAERAADWTRTITFVDKEGGETGKRERERENTIFVVHITLYKKKEKLRRCVVYYFSLCLLLLLVPMSTGTTKSYMIAVDQHHHHHEKSRRTLRIILIILGIIIVFAALFLAIVIYRTLKTGALSLLFLDFPESFYWLVLLTSLEIS